MTKLEQEIRDRLHRDVEEFERSRPTGPRTISRHVRQRVRKRQVGMVLLALATASLMVFGFVWLIPSLPGTPEIRPAGPSLAGSNIVAVPPRGQVEPVFLEDGSPAFVVAHEDGSSSVIEAFSGHVPWGLKKLLWWCPATRQFEDPFHGSQFDERGTYLEGPSPNNLGSYRTEPGDEGHLRVQARGTFVAPLPAGLKPSRSTQPNCESVDEAVVHQFDQDDVTPLEAVGDAPDGWTALEGSLTLEAGEPARLCSSAERDQCVALFAPFFKDQELLDSSGEQALEIPGRLWMAFVHEGEVVDLARTIPPDFRSSGD